MVHDCDRRERRLALALLVATACATAPIDDGFSASDGVFSTTAMTGSPATFGDTGGESSGGSTPGTTDATMTSAATMTSGASDTSDDSSTSGDDTTDASGPGPSTDAQDSSGEASSDGGEDGPMPSCGDGTTDLGEACDDGNQDDTDACLSTCVNASCGDAVVYAGTEACDDGVNDGAYGGCNPGCGSLAAYCGDASVQMQEMCEPGVALPWANVGCDACAYDFSAIPQLYCNGTCTWAGGDSCDQADADIYCRLVTGNANSVATSFQVITALDSAGFACPGYGENLGSLPSFGVDVSVWYQDTSILANHGGGSVIANAQCS